MLLLQLLLVLKGFSSVLALLGPSFTGFRIENQVFFSPLCSEYHLLYYVDGKLVHDRAIPASLKSQNLPWGDQIFLDNAKEVASASVVLARRKSFALRTIPLFMPHTLVGAIYDGETSQVLSPLVADNFATGYWLQFSRKRRMVLHLPLLTTPGIDSKKHPFGSDGLWARHISVSEAYNYEKDPRNAARKAVDVFCDKVKMLSEASLGPLFSLLSTEEKTAAKTPEYVFFKLFLVLQLSRNRFRQLLDSFDESLSYS